MSFCYSRLSVSFSSSFLSKLLWAMSCQYHSNIKNWLGSQSAVQNVVRQSPLYTLAPPLPVFKLIWYCCPIVLMRTNQDTYRFKLKHPMYIIRNYVCNERNFGNLILDNQSPVHCASFSNFWVPIAQKFESQWVFKDSVKIREFVLFEGKCGQRRIPTDLQRLTVARIIDLFALKRCQKKRNEQGYEFFKTGFEKYFV